MSSSGPAATAQLGREAVAKELQRQGWHVKETTVGRQPTLLVQRGDVKRRVRVSSRRRGDWQTSIKYGRETAPPELDGRIWVFVDLAQTRPRFYVVPEAWMAEDIHARYQAYLARHGGKRKRSPDSKHHKVGLNRIAEWRDRWDLLGVTER